MIFWLNGDVWLGDSFHCVVKETQKGYYVVELTDLVTDITVMQSGYHLRAIKLKLASELKSMRYINAI